MIFLSKEPYLKARAPSCYEPWGTSFSYLISLIWLCSASHSTSHGPVTDRMWLDCSMRFSSAQFSRSVMSDSLQPHGLQHARSPCHQLSEFTQTHVHLVSDAIQPSHPVSSPSPPTFNLSQHQGLFKWVSSSQQVVKVLEFQLQHEYFQWIFRTDFL